MIDQRDSATRTRIANLEAALNAQMRRAGRPSGGDGLGEVDERKSEFEMLEQKHFSVQRIPLRREPK